MKNNYMEWVKDNWQKSAILVLVYVLVILIPVYFRVELIEFMLLLAFPLYLVHEIEEYIYPGGFAEFFNKNLLNVNPEDTIVPVDREVIFWINMIYIWMIIPIFSGLGFYNLKFAAWIPYFFIFQAFSHLGMGIKGKKVFNPGIRSSFVLHLPYSIFMIKLLILNDIFINPYINTYMVIGFIFNGLLPVFAVMPNKYGIISRYHKRLKEEK
ncbi:hypothetical protein SH2C18_50190 [Clostridium sediminicola]|uniref:HXXEE domain-containing protein n=1 Tax=Clostridium sediminicola TaxID=3114879 RepID=UPI0031F27158